MSGRIIKNNNDIPEVNLTATVIV